jgi:hypothetical protein
LQFGKTKKKKKKNTAVRACMHAKQQERRAQSKRTSDRASERTLCDVCKFGLEQECGEDAAVRARESTILSLCRLVRSERYSRTALHRFLSKCCFWQLRSPPPDLFCCIFHEFATIQEAKQTREKEIQQFPRQQFLSSKLKLLAFFPLEFFQLIFPFKIK